MTPISTHPVTYRPPPHFYLQYIFSLTEFNMLQILPQFATLLAFTVIAARSAPHTNSHHDRRFVLDARIPGLLHSRVPRGESSDEQVSRDLALYYKG
jgi:hypothetical protein